MKRAGQSKDREGDALRLAHLIHLYAKVMFWLQQLRVLERDWIDDGREM